MTKREIKEFVEMKRDEAIERAKAADEALRLTHVKGQFNPNELELMEALCDQVLNSIRKSDIKLRWSNLVNGLERVESVGLAKTIEDDLSAKLRTNEEKVQAEYKKVLGNIIGMKPAQAETYLQSLGFTLPEVRKPVEKPMIVPVAKEWL